MTKSRSEALRVFIVILLLIAAFMAGEWREGLSLRADESRAVISASGKVVDAWRERRKHCKDDIGPDNGH